MFCTLLLGICGDWKNHLAVKLNVDKSDFEAPVDERSDRWFTKLSPKSVGSKVKASFPQRKALSSPSDIKTPSNFGFQILPQRQHPRSYF